MDDLQVLLKQDIPSGKNALLDSRNNLKNVAAYCADNYVQATNKKEALDETKKYTTQSLASVAYQINTLASNMLQMLDIQATQLANMESTINNISQTVDIHKEKVARREIGQLTTTKVINRAYQIIAPPNPDRSLKYVRKPINFNELDDLGHGVKLSSQSQSGQPQNRRPSNFSATKNSSPGNGSKRDSSHSIGSSAGYGTLRAVKAPTVPSAFPGRAAGTDFSSSGTPTPPPPPANYDALPPPPSNELPPPPMNGIVPPPPPDDMNIPPPPMDSAIPPPPMGMAAPPPPPPAPMSMPSAPMGVMPPPPPSAPIGMPPPPVAAPPPPSDSSELSETYSSASMGFDRGYGMAEMPPPPDALPPPGNAYDSNESPSQHPSWAPANFIEKVVAVYDYSAENSDELTLQEDDIVYVVKKNDDGWFEGVCKGKTGLFPGNYVEPTS